MGKESWVIFESFRLDYFAHHNSIIIIYSWYSCRVGKESWVIFESFRLDYFAHQTSIGICFRY
ncbi:hypothetical protein BJP34_20895 [Moorena producens PAL-8-15-08-1]|uniref:Uncharacterized protein n=1 Tax=Moorena producens PAL-8-15-08-1 TaxID=1458985 RepID=A0A1D8TV90_9CYAN|nr:hypothetical protein BJP34_20895 [Moorena producens PAL-8-15-08-1]